jgi:hypothetical protein
LTLQGFAPHQVPYVLSNAAAPLALARASRCSPRLRGLAHHDESRPGLCGLDRHLAKCLHGLSPLRGLLPSWLRVHVRSYVWNAYPLSRFFDPFIPKYDLVACASGFLTTIVGVVALLRDRRAPMGFVTSSNDSNLGDYTWCGDEPSEVASASPRIVTPSLHPVEPCRSSSRQPFR